MLGPGAAAGLALALTAPAATAEVTLSGEATFEFAQSTGTGDPQKLEMRLEPELDADLPGGWSFTGITRLRADVYDRLEPGAPHPVEMSSISRPLLIGDRAELELREFFVTGEIGPALLTLGKQQVVWGQADGLKILDVVNPQDFREFILPDFEVSRIPLWTVNAEAPVGPVVVQLLWIPDPTYHELPESDAIFAFTSPRLVPPPPPGVPVNLRDPDRPRRLVSDSDAGVRISAFRGGWDLTLNYLYFYDDRPVLRARPGLVGGLPGLVVTPEYERSHLVGGSFSNAFGDLTVRGELGYQFERWLPSDSPRSGDGAVRVQDLSYVIGLDWFGFDETLLSFQLFQSWLTRQAPGLIRDRLDTNVTLLLQREFWNDRLAARGIWIHNVNQGDGLVRPQLQYEVNDDVRVWGGFDLFYGTGRGLFGQFDSADRLVLGLEFGF